jgi:hypothetical protein
MTIDDVVLELEKLAKEAFQPASAPAQPRAHEREAATALTEFQELPEFQDLPEAQEV